MIKSFDIRSAEPYIPLGIILVGWVLLFGPAYWGLANTLWATDAQGHGPIILAVACWLLFQLRSQLMDVERKPARAVAIFLFLLASACYIVGRSQTVWTLEIAAQNIMLVAILLYFLGVKAVRLAWFPLLFLIFMIPWPGDWVDFVTQPLKSAVSTVSASILYAAGYPVGRSGVILTVGQYQLLVADACAGLNSLFTLEALGLLYMNLMKYTSVARNVTLAILIIPVSFIANVIRVLVLILVTYHFGDAAGQGFVHDFAGLVLFMAALIMILLVDAVLGLFFRAKKVPA